VRHTKRKQISKRCRHRTIVNATVTNTAHLLDCNVPEPVLFLVAGVVRLRFVVFGAVVVGEFERHPLHRPKAIVRGLRTGLQCVLFSLRQRRHKVQAELVLREVERIDQGKSQAGDDQQQQKRENKGGFDVRVSDDNGKKISRALIQPVLPFVERDALFGVFDAQHGLMPRRTAGDYVGRRRSRVGCG